MDCTIKPNLTQVNNVALGGTWSCQLPIGVAYRYIDVLVTMTATGGATLGGITDFLDLITINVNSKPFRIFKASEANDIYTRYGSNYAASIYQSSGSGNTLLPVLSGTGLHAPTANGQATCAFRIYFEEPWRKNWTAASARKFCTSWPAAVAGGSAQTLSAFQIQGIIPSTTNNTAATSLSVLIYAGTDTTMGTNTATGVPITNALKWYRYPGFSYSASGDQVLNNLVPYNKGQQLAILEQMTIFSQSTGDDVGRAQVNADGRIVRDVTPSVNFLDLIRHGFNATWNLDEFELVFDSNDNVSDGLVLSTATGAYVNNLAITATLDAAAGANKTLVIISQVFGPLD